MSRTTTLRAARPTTGPAARAAPQRHLAQGLSNREIGRRLGVTETTIRRWRKAVAPDAPPDLQNVAPDVACATQDDAPATDPEPPATRDDALTVALDGDLRDDLAVLASAGHDPQAAIRLAVQLLADAYLGAWDHGDAPRGTPPSIRAHTIGAPCPVPASSWGR